MPDPQQASAHQAGRRRPRWERAVGWAFGVALWATASDARPLLALVSLIVASAIRGAYVFLGFGAGRNIILSAWFFAVAASVEASWLVIHWLHA